MMITVLFDAKTQSFSCKTFSPAHMSGCCCMVLAKYRTRRFIGEELILAIGDFSENSPILNPPTLILCHKDTPTKLHAYAILLRTRGWNGRSTEWLLIVNFKIVRIPPI